MSRNTYAVQQLLVKMKNPDSDLRFMALTDLMTEIARNRDSFGTDDQTEHQTVETVLSLMNDTNGEVKNLAVKALAALVQQVTEQRIQTIIDKLVSFTGSKDEGVRDIASLGLKTVVVEIDNADSSTALKKTICTRLAPKIVQQLDSPASSSEMLIDALDLMHDVVSRFDSTVQSLPQLQSSILKCSTKLLTHQRPAVRKRAINVLARLVTVSDDALFASLVDATVLPLMSSNDLPKRKTSIALAGAIARSSPRRTGTKVASILPIVLSAASSDDEELIEQSLQTLEAFVLKCPAETSASFSEIVASAITSLKYDPNYAGDATGDDDDEQMADDDDDELGEDDFADEYSDEDDTSWKVRRSATKLLSACIVTRQDLLPTFLKTVAPALIARLGEREETVKVDVWATYALLLDHLQSSGQLAPALTPSRAGTPVNGRQLKRKRSSVSMDVGESPMSLLQAQAPAVVKSIVKQLDAKSLATRSAGFVLLHSLVRALQGGLEAHVTMLVKRIDASLKSSSDSGVSGAATTLRIEVLSFISLFLETHAVKSYADQLPDLVTMLIACVGDRLNRVAAEALTTCTELVRILRPISPSPTTATPSTPEDLKRVYAAVSARLSSPDSDEDVRSKGLVCLGQLLSCAFDLLDSDAQDGLQLLRDRLKNEVTRLTAVSVTAVVGDSALVEGAQADAWATESLVEISPQLRKVHRPPKLASFNAIKSLVRRSGPKLGSQVVAQLVEDLQTLLNDQDVVMLTNAVTTLSVIIDKCPTATTKVLHSSVTPRISTLVTSPLLPPRALDGILSYFASLVQAGIDDPASLVTSIADAAEKMPSLAGASNAARTIGTIVSAQPDLAPELKAKYVDSLSVKKRSPESQVFALHVVGEVGRVHPLDKKSFELIVGLFGASSSSEEVRRAAAFAAGNCAVGNPAEFLSPIVDLVRADDKKRMLALQSLKEVITHSTPSALGEISDQLWTPLFDNCEAQDEATRNIAADCLGQITVIDPQKYLPQLQSRLSSESKDTRATVISAIRYTFTNESTSYDELLAPLVVEFFKLIHDDDLSVRRLALSALNSAAHNKPHLLREDLSTLMPALYQQTQIDKSLIRIVEMGPFKHKVDDGLDIRKTAYECMHTLLETCFKEIDLHGYISHVVDGLKDDEEVKKLCYLMLIKLAAVASAATAQNLDDAVEPLQSVMTTKLSDNAVKQETERHAELQKSCLRCVSALDKISSLAATPKFDAFVQTIKTGQWANEYAELRASTAQQMAHLDMMDTD